MLDAIEHGADVERIQHGENDDGEGNAGPGDARRFHCLAGLAADGLQTRGIPRGRLMVDG